MSILQKKINNKKGMIIIPELPEVENVRLSLINRLKGRKIINTYGRIDTACKIIAQPKNVNEFLNLARNLEFKDIERKGKYLILKMDNYYNMIVHLGMTGLLIKIDNMKNLPKPYDKHCHVFFELDDNSWLCYCDIRRFGSMRIMNDGELEEYDSLKNIGPEPFIDNLQNVVKEKLNKKKWQEKTIKEALMDQRVIAGIGNIYACESLLMAGISPLKKIKEFSSMEYEKLFRIIPLLLNKSIRLGGTSVSDYLNGEGKRGNFQNYLNVYKQDLCPCGHKIKSEVIGGRNTFYCPICQK